MIHAEKIEDVYNKKNIPLWLLSALKAGFINTVGFLFAGKFVSHVTGFGTQVGIAIGHKEYFFVAELLVIPVAFILGGTVTSLILDKEYEAGETPPYWMVQGLITCLLILLFVLGFTGFYPDNLPFDNDENYTFNEFFAIGVLCLICGLKNGLVTWASWGRIRVTHLTGLSTDMGLNLIRTFYKKQSSPRFKEPQFVNYLRLATFLSFSAGAALSALYFPQYGFKILVIPMLISIFMSLVSLRDSYKRRRKNERKIRLAK